MRIGIFGGSFDPVHIEHIRVAQAAIQTLGLDRLLIMPAFAPPHKKGRTLAGNKARLEICRLAFSGVEKAEVCDFEIAKGGVSYTYLTCRHFKQVYKDAELFWLVGTDMLRDFPTWKNPKDILSCATLAVCARNEKTDWLEGEQRLFFERFGTNFVCVGYNGADVSSTKIRVLAAAGEDFSSLVPPAVYQYIKDCGLYEIPRAKEALALEKPSRKAHSIRVALVAAKRAVALKLDEKKAITAALFHDCAKNLPPNHLFLQGFTPPSDWGEVAGSVVHQFSGAYVAEREFGITDGEILDAVRYHTSGKPQMTELGKLIFLADMVEEERAYDGVEKIRSAFYTKSLDEALTLALQETVEFLRKKGAEIYPLTLSALKYLEEKEN